MRSTNTPFCDRLVDRDRRIEHPCSNRIALLPRLDQRGHGVPPPSSGKQPLPHRGERVRPEEGPQVQRAHYPL